VTLVDVSDSAPGFESVNAVLATPEATPVATTL
jgi:hypothetical protein